MKRLIHHKNISWLAVLLVVFALFMYLKTLKIYLNATTTYQAKEDMRLLPYENQRYTSKFLKISFDVPGSFTVEEKHNDIILKNNQGQINLSRISTNYDNAYEYVQGLSLRNHYSMEWQEEYKNDKLDIMSGIINDNKTIFIYIDNRVFTLSAPVQMTRELDQIAQSFTYLD